jgi:hypothetical protein
MSDLILNKINVGCNDEFFKNRLGSLFSWFKCTVITAVDISNSASWIMQGLYKIPGTVVKGIITRPK